MVIIDNDYIVCKKCVEMKEICEDCLYDKKAEENKLIVDHLNGANCRIKSVN